MWGIALAIEDFTTASQTALSSVPLQFLLEVAQLPEGCPNEKSTLVDPSPTTATEVTISALEMYNVKVQARPAQAHYP